MNDILDEEEIKKTKVEEVIFQSKYSKEEIRKFFEENNALYHTMNINGIKTKNTRTSSQYQMWVSQVIPNDLTGKNVLDVGCADGFYSFLCEQRNANRILAVELIVIDMETLSKGIPFINISISAKRPSLTVTVIVAEPW